MNQGQPSPAQECHLCGKHGAVLAYDVFSPETRMWFCAACWLELHYDLQANYLSVVEDRREQEAGEALKHYTDNLKYGMCPHCHRRIQEKKQVGRCVYALPCYCRLYQGTLPKKEKSIEDHPFFREQRGGQ